MSALRQIPRAAISQAFVYASLAVAPLMVVTLTTVGYGDVFPESTAGRIVAGIVALTGVGIVALPTGILASSFAEVFREHYEQEQKQKSKPPGL